MIEYEDDIDIPNEPEEVEVVSTPRLSEKILRLILTGTLFLLLVCMMLLSDKLRDITLKLDPEQTSVLTKVVNLIPDLTPETAPVVEETTAGMQEEYYVLQNSEGVSVATISAGVGVPDMVALWNDYLFYAQQTATQGAEIYAKNLQTLETTTLFTEVDEYGPNELGERIIDSYEIIDDALVFSLGGYMTEGAQYKVDLPPDKKAVKFASVMSGKFIANWHGRSWIWGGFGDACVNRSELYKLDSKTWIVTQVAEFGSDCINGQDLIGIDYRNRLLLSGFTGDKPDMIEGEKIYEYVTSVHVDNPAIVEGVIAKQDMPAEIRRLHYDDENRTLVLSGKNESYIYSLETGTSTKAAALVQAQEIGLRDTFKDIDYRIETMELPEGYKWVRK